MFQFRVESLEFGVCVVRHKKTARWRFPLLLLLCTLNCTLPPAQAQPGPNPDRDKPLEITADQTLEWHRDTKQYIARGAVVVKQGAVTIMADTMTADYRETETASFEIYRLTADGSVRIVSQGNAATGDKAVYDVDSGTAVMTGNALRLTGPDQTVTARDSFEYRVTEGLLKAIGRAKVTRGKDTLEADILSAIFATDTQGARQLRRATADGGVVITTPTERLTGRSGVYDAATDIATLRGGVTIRRGPNVLEGDSAEVNLATNVSTMRSGEEGGGRVRGVFYPEGGGDPFSSTVP